MDAAAPSLGSLTQLLPGTCRRMREEGRQAGRQALRRGGKSKLELAGSTVQREGESFCYGTRMLSFDLLFTFTVSGPSYPSEQGRQTAMNAMQQSTHTHTHTTTTTTTIAMSSFQFPVPVPVSHPTWSQHIVALLPCLHAPAVTTRWVLGRWGASVPEQKEDDGDRRPHPFDDFENGKEIGGGVRSITTGT